MTDAVTAPVVRVRFYRIDPLHDPSNNSVAPDADKLLLDMIPTFSFPAAGTRTSFPASAEIPLWLLPELSGEGRIRVQIDPLTDTRDYWAFVSVLLIALPGVPMSLWCLATLRRPDVRAGFAEEKPED